MALQRVRQRSSRPMSRTALSLREYQMLKLGGRGCREGSTVSVDVSAFSIEYARLGANAARS